MLRLDLRNAAIYVVFMVAAYGRGMAQVDESTGTVRGTVYDARNAVIPGAVVTATNPATGIVRKTISGPDGTYQIPQLNPATYKVEAAAPGFEREAASDVVVRVGQTVILDGHLLVGSVDTVVTVSGDVAPLIDAEQTQQANTLDELQIGNLPNASRNFLQEVFTLPGVGSTAGAQAQNQGFVYPTAGISLGASNGRGNLITLNSGEDDYGTGAVRFLPPLDSVQEQQVNRNGYQAEFGFASGAAINVITKSGANHFHGDVFGTFDDHNTNAENYLTALESNGAPNPYSQQIYAGGSVGGPIRKNKLFFFASYEYHNVNAATIYPLASSSYLQPFNGSLNDTSCLTATPASPNLAPSQGCFFRALALGAGMYDPVDANIAAQFLASPSHSPQNSAVANPFFPLSNPALVALISRDSGTFNTPVRSHGLVTRIDYQPGNKDTITGTFSLAHGYASLDGLTPDGRTNNTRDYEVLGDWVHVFTPNMFNKLLVQYAYNYYSNSTPDSNGPEIQLQYLAGPSGSLGHNFGATYFATQNRYELSDDLSLTKGHHNLKVGLSYRPASYSIDNPNYIQGEYDFFGGFPLSPLGGIGFSGFQNYGTIAALAAGAGYCPTAAPCIPSSVLATAPELFDEGVPYSFEGASGSGQWSGTAQYAAIYAQDLWKITPRVTLTYGGRVDWDGEPSPLSVYKFFSPRVGIAWNVFGDSKTLLRAGGGFFVSPTNFLEPLYTNLYGPLAGPNHYLTNTAVNVDQTLPSGASAYASVVGLYQGTLGAGGTPQSPTPAEETLAGIGPGQYGRLVQSIDPHFTNQKVYQASVGVAQQLATNLSLELGYLFYRGNHLPTPALQGYVPSATVTDPILGPTFTEVAPYTSLVPGGQAFDFGSNGNSIYHGATVSLTKRYSHHVEFQGNYTWSRSIDDATDYNIAFASYRPNGLTENQERGVSSFNRTNIFVANAVYNTLAARSNTMLSRVFSNVSVGPVFTAESGAPFDIDISTPFNNGTPLGNLTARPYHEQRNSGQGPGFVSFDLKATKGVPLNRENTARLDLTIDTSNLFNRQNFSSVDNFFPASVDTYNSATGHATPAGPFGPNNQYINFATGPFNLHGGKPTSLSQIQNNPSLFFNQQLPARQIQVSAKLSF